MARKARFPQQGTIVIWTIVIVVALGIGVAFLGSGADDGAGDDGSRRTHECVSDRIEATVEKNGDLSVVDSRTYDFAGSWTLTADVLDPPSYGKRSGCKVNGVSVVDASGKKTKLKKVAFKDSWRDAGGPKSGSWAFDEERSTIYAFSDTADSRKTFVFDYVYTGAVELYSDVATLYWQFVASGWDVDTRDVSATVTLPAAKGDAVRGGDNVLAFGHASGAGAGRGQVSFNGDGTVSFSLPEVESGSFAEMRVAFPRSWIADAKGLGTHAEAGLDTVRNEEAQWQQEARDRQRAAALLLVVPLVLSVLLIAAAIVLWRRFGREHRPGFRGDYWREAPAKGLHPATVARIWRWNKESADDLVATLMHLSNEHVVTIERVEETTERKILPDKAEVTYRLQLTQDDRELGTLDQAARDFVFGEISSNDKSVSFKEIEQYGDDHAQRFLDGLEGWQGKVDDAVIAGGYFEPQGEAWKKGMRLAGALILIATVLISCLVSNFSPFLGLLPGCIALFVVARFMPRRSVEAAEINARCKGLKRWFRDFTALDEAVPTDARVWGELFVYAYIFGVADKVAERLNRAAPDIWDEWARGGYGYGYLWYYDPYRASAFAASSQAGADFFGRAFENTASSAQATISAASSGGSSFGGGGGGGFGGGGGGFSR